MRSIFIMCCFIYAVPGFGQSSDQKVSVQREYAVYEENGDTLVCLQSQLSYDENGNIIEEIKYPHQVVFGCDSVFEYKDVYVYDTLNRLMKHMLYSYGAVLPFRTLRHNYTYNDSGLVLTDSVWSSDTSGQIIIFSYDTHDNVLKKIYRPFNVNHFYIPIDAFDRTITYSYDEYNNCTKIYHSGIGDGWAEHFSFDKHGNCIEYRYEGHVRCLIGVGRYVCKYDDNSKLVEKTEYTHTGHALRSINHYASSLIVRTDMQIDGKDRGYYYIYEYTYFK